MFIRVISFIILSMIPLLRRFQWPEEWPKRVLWPKKYFWQSFVSDISIFHMIVNHCKGQMYTLVSVVSISCSKKRKVTERGQKGPQNVSISEPFMSTSDSWDPKDHTCAPTDPQAITTSSPPPHKRWK